MMSLLAVEVPIEKVGGKIVDSYGAMGFGLVAIVVVIWVLALAAAFLYSRVLKPVLETNSVISKAQAETSVSVKETAGLLLNATQETRMTAEHQRELSENLLRLHGLKPSETK
jgi:hypothetical protein